MESLKVQKQRLAFLEKTEQKLKDIKKIEEEGGLKSLFAFEKGLKVQQQILDVKEKIWKGSAQYSANELSLGKQIKNLEGSAFDTLNKKFKLEKTIITAKNTQKEGTKQQQKEQQKFLGILSKVNDGSMDTADIYQAIADGGLGDMEETLREIAKTLKDNPNLSKQLELEAGVQKKIDNFYEKIEEYSAIASSPKLMGAAAFAFLAKQFFDIASSANQIRQDLGLSVSASASLGAKTTLLSKAFSLLGGDGEQIAAFSKAIASEFGSINELSFKTLTNFGLISLRTGISGDNAAKLAKSIQSIQGGSLETSLNTISTFENLSRAAGVAPKLVLDDIAESTELFAKFAKDGGENLAKAAAEARKLGLNLSAVDKISESILDFETSIEKQMEASVLLGRQLNLDKARQLALEGDLEGVLAEVKNQVGGTEALNRMNVVQRKALADAVGLEVSELSKLAAGQENVNKLANSQFISLGKTFGTIAAITTILMGALGFITAILPGGGFRLRRGLVGGRRGLKFGAKAGLAAGAVGAVGQSMMPKAQTGGVVRETGMAVVHKGETIAGTQFGGRESNKLLKQMIEQNATLMNRLTNRVGDLALSS